MKKIIISSFLALLASCLVFAQVSIDPKNSFYIDAQNWEIEGLVDSLPPLRPYPLIKIKEILFSVIENGNDNEKSLAEKYLDEYFGKNWKAELEVKSVTAIDSDAVSENLLVYPAIKGDLFLADGLASAGYKIGFSGRTSDEDDFLLLYEMTEHDSIFDPGSIGPFNFYMDTDDGFSIGSGNIFFQAGLNRSDYGSFLNSGIALNDSCYHTGNMGFTYMAPDWRYTQQFSVIGATVNDGTTDPSECFGNVYPDKFLSFHAFQYDLTDSFCLSYYETMIFGNRFDPCYLIPVPYMAAQGINGYYDNLLMGVNFQWRFADSLMWAGDLFADDIGLNALAKFDFDAKIRVAAKTGLVWVPSVPMISRVTFDLTAIAPYMYSHGEYEDNSLKTFEPETVNYENYTNCGQPVGSSYPPDSGIISIGTVIKPLNGLTLKIDGLYMLHGNISEDLTDAEAASYLLSEAGTFSTDGSIYNHTGYVNYAGLSDYDEQNSGYWFTYVSEKSRFLTQKHLMSVLQGSVKGEYELNRYNWGKVSFTFGLQCQYVHNKGVDSDIFPGLGGTDNIKQIAYTDEYGKVKYYYEYNEQTYASYSELVAYFESLVSSYREDWASKFYDMFNTYISFGVKYTF